MKPVNGPHGEVRSAAAFAAYKADNEKLLMKAGFQHSFSLPPLHLLIETRRFRCRCAWWKHPYPSRTRRLRPGRPMILCWRRHGKAGGCRIPLKRFAVKRFTNKTDMSVRYVNLLQQGSAVLYNWFLPVISESKFLGFTND